MSPNRGDCAGRSSTPSPTCAVSTAASLLGRFDLARERLSEGARLAARAGYTMATVSALEGLAATVCATGDLAGAARLLGHAKSLMDGTGAAMPGVEPTIHERTIA